MKPAVTFVLLVAVFLVAAFATAFAATLMMPAPGSFIVRLWHHALALGWAAGIGSTFVFWLLLKKARKETSR
jgi:hypothetical protein